MFVLFLFNFSVFVFHYKSDKYDIRSDTQLFSSDIVISIQLFDTLVLFFGFLTSESSIRNDTFTWHAASSRADNSRVQTRFVSCQRIEQADRYNELCFHFQTDLYCKIPI